MFFFWCTSIKKKKNMWLSIAMFIYQSCQSSHQPERPIGASPRATLRLQRDRRAGHRRWSWWYKRRPPMIRWWVRAIEKIDEIGRRTTVGHLWKWRICFPSKKNNHKYIYIHYIYMHICIWVSYSVKFHHHYPIQLWEPEEIAETHLVLQGSWDSISLIPGEHLVMRWHPNLTNTLWWTNIAIENGHRNSEFSHEKWWFSMAKC